VRDSLDLSLQGRPQLFLARPDQLGFARPPLPLKVPDLEPADRAQDDRVLVQVLAAGRRQLPSEPRGLPLPVRKDKSLLPPPLRQRARGAVLKMLGRELCPRMLEQLRRVQKPLEQ